MARKNGYKRLLMYIVVIIGALFVGFLAYYFAVNNEVIDVDEKDIYLNLGNIEDLPLTHTRPSKSTKITVSSSDENVVKYLEDTKTLSAVGGGHSTIIITTTNKKFGPFKIEVFVADGSDELPWYISTSKQFSQIGKGKQEITNEDFKISDSYELLNDIDLGNLYSEDTFWTPIPNFQGSLQGEGKIVFNLKIKSDNIDNVGLFERLDSTAKVENINFENVEIDVENAKYVGIIAGVNKGFIGKVKLNGKITSSGETTVVGGVVGVNEYEKNRPVLNMVEAKVSFETKGITGGLVGLNRAGIVFNSSVQIKDINVYEQTDEPSEDKPVVASYGFGGVAGINEGILYGDLFRQSANKNVFVRFEKISLLEVNNDYISKIGTVAYTNTNGPAENDYYIANNYINVIVVQNTGEMFYELGDNQNIVNEDKTNIAPHNDASLETESIESLGLTSVWSIDKQAKVLNLDFEAAYENPQISNPGKVIEEKQGVIDAINNIFTTTGPMSYVVDLESKEFEEHVEGSDDEKVLVIYGHEITGKKVSTKWGENEEDNWTNWTPINSNKTAYNGEFIVLNGRIIIKNLIINEGIKLAGSPSTAYGLFGGIAGKQTFIQNLGVENVKIDAELSDGRSIAGGFASSISDAIVEGITVDGIEIKDAEVAGFAFGIATNATIRNVSVGSLEKLGVFEEMDLESEDMKQKVLEGMFTYLNPPNRILASEKYSKDVNYGGFAGLLLSNIEDVSVHYGIITHNGSGESNIGGITGSQANNKKIKDAKVNHAVKIENKSTGKGYFGGIAGYVGTGAIIESSFSLAGIDIIIGPENDSHAGGITGYLSYGAEIRYSFSGDLSSPTITAKNTGGIASINYGTINQVHVAGVYKGHNVGGAVFRNYGTIENILITATVEGIGKSSSNTAAGIAVHMPKGSVAKFIISTAKISGNGSTKLFAETRTNVRYSVVESAVSGTISGVVSTIKGFFTGKEPDFKYETGEIKNYLVVPSAGAVRQKGIMGNLSFWIKVIDVTENELRMKGGSNPYAKAGFTDLEGFVWYFEEGQLPKLMNMAENPFLIIEDEVIEDIENLESVEGFENVE